jgi:acyl-coenzyme A thioesterase PaaI-like protein
MTGAREKWFPADPPPTPRRLRKHALADDVRALIADVLLLDVENAAEDELALAEEKVAAAHKAMAQLPDLRSVGMYVGADSSLFERSPLSGRSNALAAPLSMVFDGELTRGHATYGEIYQGPPGRVHGGYVISAFDDLLGVAVAVSGIAGLTGTLTVRLHSGTPLNQRIDYEAGVLSREGRKVITWGKSYCDGTLCAEATGIFIEPRGGHPVHKAPPS